MFRFFSYILLLIFLSIQTHGLKHQAKTHEPETHEQHTNSTHQNCLICETQSKFIGFNFNNLKIETIFAQKNLRLWRFKFLVLKSNSLTPLLPRAPPIS